MESIPPQKRCTKCGETFPIDAFGKNRAEPDGHQRWCRACRSAHAHRPEVQAKKAEYDQQYQAIDHDGRLAALRDRYRTDAEYRARKQALQREYHRSELGRANGRRRHFRRWVNPDYRSKAVTRLRERRHRSAEYREYLRTWKRERYRQDPERHRGYVARFLRTPAGRALQARANHLRRLRVKQAPATLTATEWQTILSKQGFRCLACGKPFTDQLPPTRDHVVPVSKGGGLTFDNTVALCKPCNSSKRDKTIDYRPREQLSIEWDDN